MSEFYPRVTRVEVIDGTGRAFVRYYDGHGVDVHLQDEGRTLKVFVYGLQKEPARIVEAA